MYLDQNPLKHKNTPYLHKIVTQTQSTQTQIHLKLPQLVLDPFPNLVPLPVLNLLQVLVLVLVPLSWVRLRNTVLIRGHGLRSYYSIKPHDPRNSMNIMPTRIARVILEMSLNGCWQQCANKSFKHFPHASVRLTFCGLERQQCFLIYIIICTSNYWKSVIDYWFGIQ